MTTKLQARSRENDLHRTAIKGFLRVQEEKHSSMDHDTNTLRTELANVAECPRNDLPKWRDGSALHSIKDNDNSTIPKLAYQQSHHQPIRLPSTVQPRKNGRKRSRSPSATQRAQRRHDLPDHRNRSNTRNVKYV